jgi:hypothetical protein
MPNLTVASNVDTFLAAANFAAMVDTLGGASSVGTGGLVRSSAIVGLWKFIGSTDASSNPNYPAASKGDTYVISVAGKIGGASGKSIEVGDTVVASADNAGGTEASVGTSWFVLEHNLAGAVLTGGALGTPSGGTLTNCTGLPAAGVVGTAAILGANTFTGQQIASVNGAASTPPFLLSGTWFTGGSAETTKPQLLIQPTGTTSTGWSTAGTGIGVNAASGFAGSLIDLQRDGTYKFRITPTASGFKMQTFADFSNREVELSSSTWISSQFLATSSYSMYSSGYVYWLNDDFSTISSALRRTATGVVALINSTNAQTFQVYGTASGTPGTDYVRASLSCSTTAVTLASERGGSAASDIDIVFTPAGSGNLKFGTHSALASETVTGYITIKDAGGTARKLAVVS